MRFANRAAVIEFIINNQLGRRNLSEQQKSLLRGRRYNTEKAARGGDRKSAGKSDEKSKAHDGPLIQESTAEKLAAEFNVSKNTIKRDGTFDKAVSAIEAANPDAKAPILSGKVKLPKKAAAAVVGMTPKQVTEIANAVAEGSIGSIEEIAVKQTKPAKAAGNQPVPSRMERIFDGKRAFKAIVQKLGALRGEIESLAKQPEGIFLAERLKAIETDLKNAQAAVKFSAPFRLCPYCAGIGCERPKDGTKSACRQSGWVGRGVKGPGQ